MQTDIKPHMDPECRMHVSEILYWTSVNELVYSLVLLSYTLLSANYMTNDLVVLTSLTLNTNVNANVR